MAFSQVEITSSPRFGSVLRDRNRQDVFEKSFKVLVKDHLRNCISFESASSDENSQNRRIDSWIENTRQPSKNNRSLRSTRSFWINKDDCSSTGRKQTQNVVDNNPKESVLSSPRGSNSRKRENLENSDSGQSEDSSRNDNLVASSLVQIWEARLNQSNGGNTANQSKSTASSSRSSSEISTNENPCSAPSIVGESAGAESADERDDCEPKSDQTVDTEPAISSNGRNDSDSGGSKWVRVADIIRRLGNDQKQAHKQNDAKELPRIRAQRPPPISSSSAPTAQNKSFPLVTCSPRIRGRQAFSDLLMQMEHDRQWELDSLLQRHVVSEFSQRGRLLSVLRFRSLQRCVAIQDRQRSNAKAVGPNQLSSESAVLHLRLLRESNHKIKCGEKKFRTSAKNSPTEWVDAALPKTQSSYAAAQPNKHSTLLEPSGTEKPSVSNVEEETIQESHKSADICLHSREASILHNNSEREGRKKEERISDMKNSDNLQELGEETAFNEEENTSSQQHPFLELQESSETSLPLQDSCKDQTVEEDQDANSQQDQYLESHDMAFMNVWEGNETEEEHNDQQCYNGETNYDWFSEISRPRSYWEDLRKHRYLEVINTRSENEEIRQLLERRTVSDFLDSDMRERIDRIMASRTQKQFGIESNGEECLNEHGQNRFDQRAITEEDIQEEEEKDEVEQEQEQEHREETEGNEGENGDLCSDDSSQSSSPMFSPSPGRSWSSKDPEIGPTSLLPTNHPSPEMELINNLREQIELLQREMLELRKSVKTCTDMNLQLQQSVNQDNPLKRKCCVCNETRVESLLYRCGHVCTCLKCAHELQWNSGKCPICRAPILDVVRVFVDSRDRTLAGY